MFWKVKAACTTLATSQWVLFSLKIWDRQHIPLCTLRHNWFLTFFLDPQTDWALDSASDWLVEDMSIPLSEVHIKALARKLLLTRPWCWLTYKWKQTEELMLFYLSLLYESDFCNLHSKPNFLQLSSPYFYTITILVTSFINYNDPPRDDIYVCHLVQDFILPWQHLPTYTGLALVNSAPKLVPKMFIFWVPNLT